MQFLTSDGMEAVGHEGITSHLCETHTHTLLTCVVRLGPVLVQVVEQMQVSVGVHYKLSHRGNRAFMIVRLAQPHFGRSSISTWPACVYCVACYVGLVAQRG